MLNYMQRMKRKKTEDEKKWGGVKNDNYNNEEYIHKKNYRAQFLSNDFNYNFYEDENDKSVISSNSSLNE